MKCLLCERLCFRVLCAKCLDSIPMYPSLREVCGVRVYCFFLYDDVDFLMRTKYYAIGSRILPLLARSAAIAFFTKIPKEIDFGILHLVGVDDYVRSLYSHTGIIIREFAKASKGRMRPIYGQLKAKNPISYAGKSLEYRQRHKRNLIFTAKERNIVIVDDIITTGTSLYEAIQVCQNAGANVRFCIALCNASNVVNI